MGILSAHECMKLRKEALTPHNRVVIITKIRTEVS
jgi:hypothetical protein